MKILRYIAEGIGLFIALLILLIIALVTLIRDGIKNLFSVGEVVKVKCRNCTKVWSVRRKDAEDPDYYCAFCLEGGVDILNK